MNQRTIKPLLASEDLAHGQLVMITGRWIFVATGLLLALLAPGDLAILRFQILVLLVLAMVNFYLYTQVVRRRPALQVVIYGVSLADLLIVTFMIMFAPQDAGVFSPLFVFYFPALLVISVAFSPRMLGIFAASTIGFYGLVAVGGGGGVPYGELVTVVIRLLMLAAVVTCGSRYGQVERARRARSRAPLAISPAPAPEPVVTLEPLGQ